MSSQMVGDSESAMREGSLIYSGPVEYHEMDLYFAFDGCSKRSSMHSTFRDS